MSEPHDRRKAQNNFLQQTTATLDAAEQQIDAATQTRLRAARREAQNATTRSCRPAWLLPASGGLAVAATVAALTVSLWQVPPAEEQLDALQDIALLSDEADPEFYADLEFYAWLAEGAPADDDNG